MPSTDIMDANIQNQIDAYVRGKMSPDQEIEFETKYLGDHEVIKEIERLYALRQGLGLVEHKKTNDTNWIKGIINYLRASKTAWSAIATAVLLIPMGFMFHVNYVVPVDKDSIYIISESNTRSVTNEIKKLHELNIPREQKKFWLGFKVPPLERVWTLDIKNLLNKTVWHEENLRANKKSKCNQLVICINMTGKILPEGEYTYTAIPNDEQENAVEGRFKIVHK